MTHYVNVNKIVTHYLNVSNIVTHYVFGLLGYPWAPRGPSAGIKAWPFTRDCKAQPYGSTSNMVVSLCVLVFFGWCVPSFALPFGWFALCFGDIASGFWELAFDGRRFYFVLRWFWLVWFVFCICDLVEIIMLAATRCFPGPGHGTKVGKPWKSV